MVNIEERKLLEFTWTIQLVKTINRRRKKQFEKCLTFKLNNYLTYVEDLPF